MTEVTGPLPRGRHRLSRQEVVRSQRTRLLNAMVAEMTSKGYAGTTVAEVTRAAGVSKETFYQQFTSKQDCFSAALDETLQQLIAVLLTRPDAGGSPQQRCAELIGAYLDALAGQPALARMFLVEVYAAGPAAIQRRTESQQRFVDAFAEIFGGTSALVRFACEVLVAAIGSMVTPRLVAGDLAGLRGLYAPLMALVDRAIQLSGLPSPASHRPSEE